MRITRKGQVTIPIEVRDRLGLMPDTEVEFSVKGNTAVLRKKRDMPAHRGRRLIHLMRGKAATRLTTDQIMALTRRG